jgi:hypothetical protein
MPSRSRNIVDDDVAGDHAPNNHFPGFQFDLQRFTSWARDGKRIHDFYPDDTGGSQRLDWSNDQACEKTNTSIEQIPQNYNANPSQIVTGGWRCITSGSKRNRLGKEKVEYHLPDIQPGMFSIAAASLPPGINLSIFTDGGRPLYNRQIWGDISGADFLLTNLLRSGLSFLFILGIEVKNPF